MKSVVIEALTEKYHLMETNTASIELGRRAQNDTPKSRAITGGELPRKPLQKPYISGIWPEATPLQALYGPSRKHARK